MHFNDRLTLGETLSGELQEFRKKNAVILCLKDEALLTCLAIAKALRAWVYPFAIAPVYSRDGVRRLLGAYDEEGAFCLNPENPETDIAQLPSDVRTDIEQQKQEAVETIRQRLAKYEMKLDKHIMDGRDVIIVGDVVTSTLLLTMAMQRINTVAPKSLTIAIGNASLEVANLVHLSAEKTVVLDVLSGIISDDNRYFEHPDAYTEEQKYKLTQNIAAYWQ